MPVAKADVLTRLVNEHHSRLRPTISEPPPPATSSKINGQTAAGEAISMGVVLFGMVRPRRRRSRITRRLRALMITASSQETSELYRGQGQNYSTFNVIHPLGTAYITSVPPNPKATGPLSTSNKVHYHRYVLGVWTGRRGGSISLNSKHRRLSSTIVYPAHGLLTR